MRFSIGVFILTYVVSALVAGLVNFIFWSGGSIFAKDYHGFVFLVGSAWLYALIFGLPGILLFWICFKKNWLKYWHAGIVGVLMSLVFGFGFFILLPGSLSGAISFLFFYRQLIRWGGITVRQFFVTILIGSGVGWFVYATLPETEPQATSQLSVAPPTSHGQQWIPGSGWPEEGIGKAGKENQR